MVITELNSKPRLMLHISFPKTCNMNCWFCSQGNNEEKKDFSKIEMVNLHLDNLAEFLNTIEVPCCIDIIGGEPLLYDIPKLAQLITNKNLIFGFTTNGLLYEKISLIEKICKQNRVKFAYKASLHETELSDWRKWIANLPKNSLSSINIVQTKDNIDFVSNFINEYKEKLLQDNIRITVQENCFDKVSTDNLTNMKLYKTDTGEQYSKLYIRQFINQLPMKNRKLCNSAYSLKIFENGLVLYNCNTKNKKNEIPLTQNSLKMFKTCKTEYCSLCSASLVIIDLDK